MKILSVATAAAVFAGSANAELVYSSSTSVKVNGMNSSSLPGTEVIAGNVSRTVMFEARTASDVGTEPYNYIECGSAFPTSNTPIGNGVSFSIGRWFGDHGTSATGLACHTRNGCYNTIQSKSVKKLPIDTKWHNIAHTWDGETHRLYWDGELFSEGADSNGELNTEALPCVLGGKDYRFGNFDGEINNIEIWSEAKDAAYIKAKYETQAKKKITWKVSNRVYTPWRPAVREVQVFSDEACTLPVEKHMTRCAAHNPGDGSNSKICENAFDGYVPTGTPLQEPDKFYRPHCHKVDHPSYSGKCFKGEAWLEFTTSEEIHCIIVDDLGQGGGGGYSWNGGINVLRNGVNFLAARGEEATTGNTVSWSEDYTSATMSGFCSRSIGQCTGSSLVKTTLSTLTSEAECLSACVNDGADACEANYDVSTKMISCEKVTGDVDPNADGEANSSCYVLKDCGIPLDGMMAWFAGENANDTTNTWASNIGSKTAMLLGGYYKHEESGAGASAFVKGVAGGRDAQVTFNQIVGLYDKNKEYTVCVSARYTTTDHMGRILTGDSTVNWLLGHHAGFTGQSYNGDGWTTGKYSKKASDLEWSVTCMTNNDNVVVENGIEIGRLVTRSYHPGNSIKINHGNHPLEASDFHVSDVLSWGRKFDSQEMIKVSNYLIERLNREGEFKTPPLMHTGNNADVFGLTCGSVPEVKFERMWSHIGDRTHVDLEADGTDFYVNFEVTGDGPGITILFVNSGSMVSNADGDLTEATEGVELFIGGASEPVYHVSKCLGCAPESDSIMPIVNPLIKPAEFTDLHVKLSSGSISVSTGKYGEANEQVYSYSLGAHDYNRAIFSYGYNDMECA